METQVLQWYESLIKVISPRLWQMALERVHANAIASIIWGIVMLAILIPCLAWTVRLGMDEEPMAVLTGFLSIMFLFGGIALLLYGIAQHSAPDMYAVNFLLNLKNMIP